MAYDGAIGLPVAVVSADPETRASVARALRLVGFRVAEYEGGAAFEATGEPRAACVLIDANLPHGSGFDLLDSLGGAHSPVPALMMAMGGDVRTAVAAIKAGAHDFIENPSDARTLADRVRLAIREHAESGRRGGWQRGFPGADALTAREHEVLEQIVQGASNKEAGRILGISPRTVEVHRARIMDKLRARNTADLMRIVLAEGRRAEARRPA